ncbi:hypothetical protein L1987_62573 [Smallanthus sonchifolius]|uniref:Uncharacterized protein n=1 Tax=Smallanthus sonchifolius TaxID=185202 RepID=A0ACB9CAY4_9ASTR|nr:hypothetical protein L1987_62573 [Smallanthus sonchifolius]
MSSLQCLMGGNVVQFQDSSSISPTTRVLQSSSLDNNNDDKRNMTKTKTKKTKKKKDTKVIKLFKPDGEINLYHKPIMVSEVMTDECMVCRSDSFYIGQKIPPLAQHDRLQPGHTYFLLPSHLFHSVLSFVTIASFTSSSCSKGQEDQIGVNAADANMKMKAAFLKKAAASSCSPFDIQKTTSGTLRIRVSEMFISQLMMDQASNQGQELIDVEASADHLLCTTPQLHREYKQLVVGSRRGWKPKLEMIKETPLKGKRKVKMLLSASISRMKRKINNNKDNPQIASAMKKRKKKVKTKKSVKPISSGSLKHKKVSKTK